MGFFIAISILASILAAVLVWIVPHLFDTHADQFANQTTQLQQMCEDVIDEQKALVHRQTALNDELIRFQQQLVMLTRPALLPSGGTSVLPGLQHIEARFDALQRQLATSTPAPAACIAPCDEVAQLRLLRAVAGANSISTRQSAIGNRKSAHVIRQPPSTKSVCPVMYDANGDARNSAAAATSSGCPAR